MINSTIVIDTNIYTSSTLSRRNLTNYRVGLNSSAGYNLQKLTMTDGQTYNSVSAVQAFLMIVSCLPFTLTTTINSQSVVFGCNRLFTCDSSIASWSINNTAGNGNNNFQIFWE